MSMTNRAPLALSSPGRTDEPCSRMSLPSALGRLLLLLRPPRLRRRRSREGDDALASIALSFDDHTQRHRSERIEPADLVDPLQLQRHPDEAGGWGVGDLHVGHHTRERTRAE